MTKEVAKKFLDGYIYRGYYIVSAKKCEYAESIKGFSIFKIAGGNPIWDEVDGELLNMNLAKERVDILSALNTPAPKSKPIFILKDDDLVPMQEQKKVDAYLFSYIPKKHKDSILAIYKDGNMYHAEITNGKTVDGYTNWDSFKRAIRRAIEE